MLHIAAMYSREDVVKLLLTKRGVDPFSTGGVSMRLGLCVWSMIDVDDSVEIVVWLRFRNVTDTENRECSPNIVVAPTIPSHSNAPFIAK